MECGDLFRFYDVPENLQTFVRSIAFASSEYATGVMNIAPTGYVYLSRLFGESCDSIKTLSGEKIYKTLGVNHFSLYTKKNDLKMSVEGEYRHLVVEFTATGFYELFHYSPKEFNRFIVTVESILPEVEQRLNVLFSRYMADSEIIRALGILVEERAVKALKVPRTIKDLASAIELEHGCLKVSDFYQGLKQSPGDVANKFQKIVGVKPKEFARTIQMNFAINLISEHKFESFTEVAIEAGYFDQPHFVRCIKKHLMATPKEVAKAPGFEALKKFLGCPVQGGLQQPI